MALSSSAELLLHQGEREVRDRSAATIVREAQRCGRLLKNLLLLARLDGGAAPSRSQLDVRRIVGHEVARARQLSPRLDVTVVAPPGPVVVCAAEQLTEVMANLLDNARRHARGKVDVEVDVGGETVRVRVADDGPGVAPGDAERTFERFVTGGGGGSGLGLAIARAVAREHDGDLRWTGVAFELTLPLGGGPAGY